MFDLHFSPEDIALLKRYFRDEELTEEERDSAEWLADDYWQFVDDNPYATEETREEIDELRERLAESTIDSLLIYLELDADATAWQKRREAEADARYEEEQRQREAHEELVSRAFDVVEDPEVSGEWASIARRRMRNDFPEEWIRMVQDGEASEYLQKIQAETHQTFNEMRDAELLRRGTAQKENYMENLSERTMIDMQIRDILARQLAGVE